MYDWIVDGFALQIGELANKSGVSIDTVRYYEKRRLISSHARTAGGYRLFNPNTAEQIKFIRQARELGFSLDEIGVLLKTGGVEECEQVRDLLHIKLAELDRQIKKLNAFRKTLNNNLSACENELDAHGGEASCPVLFDIEKVP